MSTDENPTKTQRPQPEPGDIIWGAANIGRVVGLTERQAFYLLETGKLPAKRNGRWCASRAKLLEACGA
jgi:hypothetical protein